VVVVDLKRDVPSLSSRTWELWGGNPRPGEELSRASGQTKQKSISRHASLVQTTVTSRRREKESQVIDVPGGQSREFVRAIIINHTQADGITYFCFFSTKQARGYGLCGQNRYMTLSTFKSSLVDSGCVLSSSWTYIVLKPRSGGSNWAGTLFLKEQLPKQQRRKKKKTSKKGRTAV
jgi:hypothetical protein